MYGAKINKPIAISTDAAITLRNKIRLVQTLPTGMQIIGRRNADIDVLAASATFEKLRPWHDYYRICRERSLRV